MNIKLATSLFIIGAALAPIAAHAEPDADRGHPLTYVKDSIITVKVKANLADEKMSTLKHISVDTDSKGAVVLGGRVRSEKQADKAIAIARATEGVTSVTSNIRVKNDD